MGGVRRGTVIKRDDKDRYKGALKRGLLKGSYIGDLKGKGGDLKGSLYGDFNIKALSRVLNENFKFSSVFLKLMSKLQGSSDSS